MHVIPTLWLKTKNKQCILLQRWSLLLNIPTTQCHGQGTKLAVRRLHFHPAFAVGQRVRAWYVMVCRAKEEQNTLHTHNTFDSSPSVRVFPWRGKKKIRCDLCPVDTHGVIGGNSYVSNKYVTEQNDSNAAFVATSFSCPLDSKHFIPGIVPVP